MNDQAQNRLELIIDQMKVAEGVTEHMKQHDKMAWVGTADKILGFFLRRKRVLAKYTKEEKKKAIDLYIRYGNIEPTEYDTSSCKEYKKPLELICKNEGKFKATLTDEQKWLFDKYADCVQEYQTITDCLIFLNSFKLGAKMMLEVMEK